MKTPQLVTPAQVLAFFSLAEESEATFTFQTAREIVLGRGLISADGGKKRGPKTTTLIREPGV